MNNRKQLRREADKRNNKYRDVYLLVIAMVFVFGVLFGQTMEKNNQEHLQNVRAEQARVK